MIIIIVHKGGDILRLFVSGEEVYDLDNWQVSIQEYMVNYSIPRFGVFFVVFVMFVLNAITTRARRRPQEQVDENAGGNNGQNIEPNI